MLSTAPAVSEIRAFNPAQDAIWLHRLWHRTMHARWSLSLDKMQQVLADAGSLLVAERGSLRLGFCAADYRSGGDASLLTLLVEPTYQRQGVGSALISQLERLLQVEEVGSLHLGATGTGTYFWPGVPTEHQPALSFFARHGWRQEESCADLVRELASFSTPGWVSERIKNADISLRLADFQLRTKVAAFEQAHFPAWASFIENVFAASGDEDILVAQTADGAVVGTILMKVGMSDCWTQEADVQTGSLNILGVAPGRQRQGIGLALTAGAMEILRDRGCSRCFIQWTGLIEWYGKLGATMWAEYRRASTSLSGPNGFGRPAQIQPLVAGTAH